MWPQGSLFNILGPSVLLCPVSNCYDLPLPFLVLTESTLWEEKSNVDTRVSMWEKERVILVWRTFKMKYLVVEGTSVHQSIKDKKIEVKKEMIGSSL